MQEPPQQATQQGEEAATAVVLPDFIMDKIVNHCKKIFAGKGIPKAELMLRNPKEYLDPKDDQNAGAYFGDSKKFSLTLMDYKWHSTTPEICLPTPLLATVIGLPPENYRPRDISVKIWTENVAKNFNFETFFRKWHKHFPDEQHCCAWLEWARKTCRAQTSSESPLLYHPLNFPVSAKNPTWPINPVHGCIVLEEDSNSFVKSKRKLLDFLGKEFRAIMEQDTWMARTNKRVREEISSEELKRIARQGGLATLESINDETKTKETMTKGLHIPMRNATFNLNPLITPHQS